MEKQKEIKVLLVDDYKMMRNVLRNTINNQQNVVVIGEASNGEEAIIFAKDNFPDVIVMDVNMPVMGGIEATKIIMAILPQAKIIGLSLHESPTVKENMHKAGATAYISKDEDFDKLYAMIHKEGTPKT